MEIERFDGRAMRFVLVLIGAIFAMVVILGYYAIRQGEDGFISPVYQKKSGSAGADQSTILFSQQSSSDEVNDIANDVYTTNFKDLDAELNQIDFFLSTP